MKKNRLTLLPLLAWLVAPPSPAQAWVQRTPAASPTARAWHAMAYDGNRGVTVLFGGRASSGLLGDTWEWNGTNWLQRQPPASPCARGFHAMVYDSRRQVVVLYGGTNGLNMTTASMLADTWEWNGANWTQRPTASSPGGRCCHAMAFDAGRGATVLYGGYPGFLPSMGDTWEYSGANWIQTTPPASPGARFSHAMAHDAGRQRTVLQGGTTNSTNALNDTWEYDGAARTWARCATGSPTPARSDHALVFDPLWNRAVLFGGWIYSGRVNDTWDRTGAAAGWTKILPTGNPPARNYFAMAMDTGRRRVVLFGGYTGVSPVLDNQTWEYNPRPPQFSFIASGCKGSNQIVPFYSVLATIGANLDLNLLFAQANVGGLLVFGLTNPNLSLAPIGAPNCLLLSSLDLAFPIQTNSAGSWAPAPVIPVPLDVALVGASLYSQVLVLDTQANALGLVATNGGQMSVGN